MLSRVIVNHNMKINIEMIKTIHKQLVLPLLGAYAKKKNIVAVWSKISMLDTTYTCNLYCDFKRPFAFPFKVYNNHLKYYSYIGL